MSTNIIFGGSGFIGQHLLSKLGTDYINYDIAQYAGNYKHCDVRKSIQLDLPTQKGFVIYNLSNFLKLFFNFIIFFI